MKSLLLVLLLIVASFTTGYSQATVQGVDGVEVEITDQSRIITIGGSVTETVYALGAGDQVIAVDESSTYPSIVHTLPKVPYVRTLSAEGILGLSPTLIISSDEASPQTAITHIRSAGVPVLIVSDRPTLGAAEDKIRLISEALGLQARADELIADMHADLEEAEQIRSKLQNPQRVMFLLSAAEGQNSFMAGGSGTSSETMINLAGGVNIFQSFEGYKPVSPESVAAANPEVILMMSDRGDIDGGANPIGMPGIQLTDAARNERIISMDGNFLLGFGPRTGKAVLDLMNRLHPDELLPVK